MERGTDKVLEIFDEVWEHGSLLRQRTRCQPGNPQQEIVRCDSTQSVS